MIHFFDRLEDMSFCHHVEGEIITFSFQKKICREVQGCHIDHVLLESFSYGMVAQNY